MKDESLKCTETHSCENKRTETHDWIPVTEALPKNGHYYLKCTKYGNVDVDYYWDGFENATKYGEEIVAWMEKPKPYKGKQESEVKNDFSKTGRCDQQRTDTDYH